MRGLCVVTGLAGTVLQPYLSGRIGLIRAGTWSLWLELVPLALPVIALYAFQPSSAGHNAPASWITAILFLGLALSRVGLWSFDLCSVAQVQVALNTHPRRNALMGLTFALQNVFDLGHYSLTLGWNRPEQFKYPATISFVAVAVATVVYMLFYARRVRGHLVHADMLSLQRLLSRKER